MIDEAVTDAVETYVLPEWRNPTYNVHGTIDIEFLHPVFGWLPFTASPDDVESHGREFYAAALAAGNIAAYVPPTPEQERTLMPNLSRKQLRLGMRDLQVTTAMINEAISKIPDLDEHEVAQIEWDDSDSYARLHPLILQLSAAFNLTDDQVDAAWRMAATYV